METFIIPPDQNSYSFSDFPECISVELEGGAPKIRKDIANSFFRLNVQWSLNQDQYNYIRYFYRYVLNSGALPFFLDLYVDDPFELKTHQCQIVPGSFGLANQKGNLFVVKAVLYVKPIEMDQDNQEFGVVYAIFGENYLIWCDYLNIFINVTIPEILL